MRAFLVPLAAAAALLLAMPSAEAHAHLLGSVPANGSTVATAPARVTLHFSEGARITAAWLARDSAPRRPLRPLPTKVSAQAVIALPRLAPGRYVLSWRALSQDGHIVTDEIRFTVRSHGPAGAAPR